MTYRTLLLISLAACAFCGIAAAQERGINTSDGYAKVNPPPPGADPEIDAVFDRHKGAFYALYGRALRDNPKLQGKVVFEFTVQTSGETTGCRIVSSGLRAPELEQKMCTRLNLIRFQPRDKAKTTTKTLDFFPA